ncbi:MFS transporter, UMF1 family [Hydrobacter penzbergensis]|jgi:UMF1 family MFS transporter|uniref:MFS transporter, UMF1 family n=1 Tax=Hydrobacter penzbergensis TaxID=1235997 RepID=A0A8X8IG45_9BACT|nr:MFS transporter [Hydrobacter penzbergensis]MBN8719037.1 MFS transporter [Sediminibacterium magnilacihabitans]PQV60916.1 UMF1 family MFS transporter [Sediminibacterium magnilacihabitans]SDW93448.1 MFS transporter, UMF1 family [Hydrobacter penzbergensis]
MKTASQKVITGWAMYDWANSVYSLVITSTIFPAYYEAVTGDGNDATSNDTVHLFGREFVNTSLYNYALAFAFLVVAIMSPLLSSIADYKGNKKTFLFFFCTMGSIACSALYFFDSHNLAYGLACMIIACIGFWSSLVFYNSFLPEIAAPEDRDRVSAKGYALGYIGSVILQVICFVFVLVPDKFGITTGKASQISFLLVGIWWWGFGQFSLNRLPKSQPAGLLSAGGSLLTNGYKELRKVWKQLTHLPVLKRYLGAFFFYNMGVQTVMLAATLYGKSELNIPTTNLIISILIIQVVAIPGAYLIARLSEKLGNFNALMITVVLWIFMCIIGYLLPRNGIYEFYALATLVGFVMGGIQSLSRSTYAKLMPETRDTTSFFSFYDVTEKIAIVIGTFSFGYINEATKSQRNSVLALVVFFVIGLALLIFAASTQRKLAKQTA